MSPLNKETTSVLFSNECTYELDVCRVNSEDKADLSAFPNGAVFGTNAHCLSTSGFSIRFRAHFAFKYSNSRTLPNLEDKILLSTQQMSELHPQAVTDQQALAAAGVSFL